MATARKCNLCKTRDMVETTQNPEKGSFMLCPNCDSPKGTYQKEEDEE